MDRNRTGATGLDHAEKAAAESTSLTPRPELMSLDTLGPGHPAVIRIVGRAIDGRENAVLERRLLEIGFEEGREAEVRHIGPFGGDPIAVRVDKLNIALRRGEAAFVLVAPVRAQPMAIASGPKR